MKEAEAWGAASQIKPEMPRGLQALITTAPIKRGLDANQRRQNRLRGEEAAAGVCPAGHMEEVAATAAAAARRLVTVTGHVKRKFRLDFPQLDPFFSLECFPIGCRSASLASQMLRTLQKLRV